MTVGMRIVNTEQSAVHRGQFSSSSANEDRRADCVMLRRERILLQIPSGQYRKIEFKLLASRSVFRLSVGTVTMNKSGYSAVCTGP